LKYHIIRQLILLTIIMTTLVNNITNLHSKFSIFRNNNETVYNWTDILLSLNNNSKFNDIYYSVFNSNLKKNI